MATLTPEAQAVFGATYANPDELWLGVFFTPTEASQAAGRALLRRLVGGRVAQAQINAIGKWVLRARARLTISERLPPDAGDQRKQ
jgi:hypothetical protein